MIQTILGIKKEMTTKFNEAGENIPATVIFAEPNFAVKLGQDRLQVGLGKKKKIKKTENAFTKAAGFSPKFIREIKFQQSENEAAQNQQITVSFLKPGDLVKVSAVTKGKGFAGSVKRWGFHGGPKTHGQSDRHRAPGSIGQATTPGRVYKGKKMAGHMGAAKITLNNLEVLEVNNDQNLILVKGPIPGPKSALVVIEKTGSNDKFIPLKSGDSKTEKTPATEKDLDTFETSGNVELKAATTENTDTANQSVQTVDAIKSDKPAPAKEEENASQKD